MLVLLLIANVAFATSVEPKSLKDLVREASNIFSGKVVEVRMTDNDGHEIFDPDAMTGPGINNTIYFDVDIDQDQILKSSVLPLPMKVSIPLWQMWHYSLGDLKDVEGTQSFFLLDDEMKPVYPAGFQRSLDEGRKIRDFIYIYSDQRKERKRHSKQFK